MGQEIRKGLAGWFWLEVSQAIVVKQEQWGPEQLGAARHLSMQSQGFSMCTVHVGAQDSVHTSVSVNQAETPFTCMFCDVVVEVTL